MWQLLTVWYEIKMKMLKSKMTCGRKKILLFKQHSKHFFLWEIQIYYNTHRRLYLCWWSNTSMQGESGKYWRSRKETIIFLLASKKKYFQFIWKIKSSSFSCFWLDLCCTTQPYGVKNGNFEKWKRCLSHAAFAL